MADRAERRETLSVTSKTTTYGIVARDAPIAVIFRRGPTRHTRLLCWDLRDNTIRAGQWLIGAVDPGPCGVSPNGKLMIYEARKGGRTFTAISRPPYFTALALWEYSAPWTGGGFFADDDSVVLGLKFEDPRSAGAFPPGFKVTDVWDYFSNDGQAPARLRDAVCRAPQANQGWSTKKGADQKPSPVSRLRLERTPVRPGERFYRMIDEGLSSTTRYDLGVMEWADWGHDGALLSGKEGRLYRQQMPGPLVAPDPSALVADLTGQRFERILAPAEATRWPTTRGKRPGP